MQKKSLTKAEKVAAEKVAAFLCTKEISRRIKKRNFAQEIKKRRSIQNITISRNNKNI